MDDPDSAPNQLIFNIIEAGSGHFEYLNKLDVPIRSFTQEELGKGRVTYMLRQNAANESYILLQVSDGIETSSPSRLRVLALQQYWRLQNNTGLVLLHETWAVITPYNLSFVSNVVNSNSELQLEVIHGPQFGIVEVEKDSGRWKSSTVFLNSELKQHRVRYRHVTSKPDLDEFQVFLARNVQGDLYKWHTLRNFYQFFHFEKLCLFNFFHCS